MPLLNFPALPRKAVQSMKILNIHFKNINSLEGESRIDFERAPFSDAAVFAITGPNGSGKSSILDAITLGLYGETFRFDRPAQHVMTKHTAECYSEIEFALDNVKYRSSWHAQRENGHPDGELIPPTMQLIRLSDSEVLANSPQQVGNQIAEITGMNFRNFTRSILLAQGDFAAFLNALDTERLEILEKIIGTDIYADYKNEVAAKAAEAQQRLEHLKQDLAVMPYMPPEQVEACEHDLADFTDQAAELRAQQIELKQQQAALQNVLALQDNIAAQENMLQQIQQQAASERQKLEQVELAQDALQFQDDLQAIKEKNHDLHQGKAALAELRDELKQIQSHIDPAQPAPADLSNKSAAQQGQTLSTLRAQIGQLNTERHSESDLWQSLNQQIAEKTATLDELSVWLEEHTADQSLVTSFPETARLKKLRADLAELKAKQKAYTKWSKNTASSLKVNQSAIAQESKQIAELQHKLPLAEKALDELAQGRTLDELEQLRQDQQERIIGFRQLYNLAVASRKLSKSGFSFFGLFQSKDQSESSVEELEAELEKLKQDIGREENVRIMLETAVFRENLLRKVAPDRQYLSDNEPCFLCGALNHPYATHPPRESNSQPSLNEQKAKIKALRVSAGKLVQQIKTAQKQSEKNQANQSQLLKINSQWQTLCNRLNAANEDLTIKKLRVMKRLIAEEKAKLKNIAKLIVAYKKKQAGIEQMKALIEKGEATVQRLQQNGLQLDAEQRERPKEEIDYEAALAAAEQQEQQLAEQVLAQLALLGEKMPAKGKEDALFERLNARRQEYQVRVVRHKNLAEELENLKAKAEQCQAAIDACTEKLTQLNLQLHGEEIVGLHLALIEKQKLIADKEQLLAGLEAQLHALKQALQQKMQGTRFTDVHELTEMLELLQHRPEHERHLAELEQEIDAKTIELDKARQELEAEPMPATVTMAPEQLDAQLKSVTEKLAIAGMEIQRLERLLEEQKQSKQKTDAVLAQLQQQEELVRQCNADVAQLTEESGMAFRRRVQKQVAERLLSQTNAVLEKISGRYYLRQKSSEQGLALEIEDTFQNNARRLPKTLSGGESFVVSLALALGLAELANGGKSVDSLFLDEGFGNLDDNSLVTVIGTLESLRAHGKTVGVISHVERVKKRFKAQLQVVKKPNGMGMLKLAS